MLFASPSRFVETFSRAWCLQSPSLVSVTRLTLRFAPQIVSSLWPQVYPRVLYVLPGMDLPELWSANLGGEDGTGISTS